MSGINLITDEDYENYLKKINFSKRLKKLTKQLKDKKIVIYGAGMFFEKIQQFYDLSTLNIVGISDKKFAKHLDDEKFARYPVCAPYEIADLNPDVVLVATLNFINIIETLENYELSNTEIEVRPLIKKPFLEILKEIWG